MTDKIPVSRTVLKQFIAMAVRTSTDQHHGAIVRTMDCSICGGGEYGSTVETHESDCELVALKHEVERSEFEDQIREIEGRILRGEAAIG